MSTKGPQLFDADLHILEEAPVFTEYLEKKYRDRIEFRRIVPADDEPDPPLLLGWDVRIDNLPIPRWLEGHDRSERAERVVKSYRNRFKPGAGFKPEQYLADLDRDGIEKGVIYPTMFLWAPWFPQIESEFSAALCRAYNDYIYDFAAIDRARLFPAACISLHDPNLAIQEIERVSKKDFAAVFVRPNPIRGRTLGHRDYYSVYEALQSHQLSLGIHEGSLAYQPTVGADRVRTQACVHILAHPFEQMAAMVSMYEGEIFHRFPNLQILFLEAGTAWVPYWIERIDAEKKQYRPGNPKGEASMTEIFNRQCWVTSEADDEALPRVVDWIGDDRILMSTDYPHDESTYPNSGSLWNGLDVAAETLEKISRSNPYKAYPRLPRG